MQRLVIDHSGRMPAARQVPSPNCDARPEGTAITLAVIHGISLPPGEYGGPHIEALFTNSLDASHHPYFNEITNLRVSAHFLIRRDGELVQFVACDARAWHAGVSCWQGRERCNDYSIGVELEGSDDARYTDAQYAMLAQLLRALRERYSISHVVGHSDIAPDRKTDPGSGFDWERLRRDLRDSDMLIGA